MIRTIFVWCCIALGTVIFGLAAIISFLFDRKGTVAHRCGRIWAKVALLANQVKVRMEGLENVKETGPYIFMSNHQGSYDIFALLGYLPFQFKWLAKKELFSVPILGWAMSAAGYISIDRQGTRETVEAMREATRKIRDGMSVVVFPEGSRTPDGSIQPFRKGGFTLAIRSQVPIVPIAIRGSREIMPKDRLTANPGEIRVRIGPPIETQGYSMKSRESLMEKVREMISENFASGERERG
jgi:1-acyl-sn-glycerol-3-phosphate acyltransferase